MKYALDLKYPTLIVTIISITFFPKVLPPNLLQVIVIRYLVMFNFHRASISLACSDFQIQH